MSMVPNITETTRTSITKGDPVVRDRPRLVMIVDNRVVGDSRVEKSARTAVEAGYETYVIGRAFLSTLEESDFAGARLVRVPVTLDRNVHVWNRPRRGLTAPLAFSGHAEYQHAMLMQQARTADQKARILRLKSSVVRSAGWEKLAARARLDALRTGSKARALVFRLRAAQFRRGTEKAQNAGGVFYDTRARLWRWLAPGSMWRILEPLHLDYEMAYGPVIDDLAPDVIHAHDFRAIGIAVRAKWRAEAGGRRIGVVYDAHEHVPGLVRNKEFVLANDAHVAEYIPHVDAVVTVSPHLADELKRHYRLQTTPSVVLNVPMAEVKASWPAPDIRERLDLGADIPLIVHSGSVAPERGLDLVVKALPHIPDLHFAIVAGARTPLALSYLDLAAELRVADRVHLVRYVPSDQVASFLASATLACIPMTNRTEKHHVAAPTKFYEYLHARLPMVVSNTRVVADAVRRLGIGEVFRYDEPGAIVTAIRHVLADLPRYRAALEAAAEARREYSWEHQAEDLQRVWGNVNPSSLPLRHQEVEPRHGLLIGRVNSAGQAASWTGALKAAYPGVVADAFAVEKPGGFAHRADVLAAADVFGSENWQREFLERAKIRYSHVLVESLHALLPRLGTDVEAGLSLFERNQLRVGIVFHGSDIRDPELHRQLNPNSPFPLMDAAGHGEYLTALRDGARLRRDVAEWFGAPIFVSTPDLLDYVDPAWWLPVAIDAERWATTAPVLERDRPVVLHAPSNELLKGSQEIDEVLTRLADRHVIDYTRIGRASHGEMPALLASADIVVDQLHLGLYGVLACEAMAAGRLVISEVGERIRRRVPVGIPIVEVDHRTLEQRILEVASDPGRFVATADSGPDYIRRFHDGAHSARVLARWMGLATQGDLDALEKEGLCRI
jgi:glycosyltransferase involved in cell wall biosynthesis